MKETRKKQKEWINENAKYCAKGIKVLLYAGHNCKFWNINSPNFANSDKNIPLEILNTKRTPAWQSVKGFLGRDFFKEISDNFWARNCFYSREQLLLTLSAQQNAQYYSLMKDVFVRPQYVHCSSAALIIAIITKDALCIEARNVALVALMVARIT